MCTPKGVIAFINSYRLNKMYYNVTMHFVFIKPRALTLVYTNHNSN